MKIRDLRFEQIYVGMKVKGLKTGILGRITKIDPVDDNYCWIQWDNEDRAYSGFYGNDCDCEVVDFMAFVV